MYGGAWAEHAWGVWERRWRARGELMDGSGGRRDSGREGLQLGGLAQETSGRCCGGTRAGPGLAIGFGAVARQDGRWIGGAESGAAGKERRGLRGRVEGDGSNGGDGRR